MTDIQPKARLGLREKLVLEGVQSLSDTELLAVFISSGSAQNSCLQLAAQLLNHLGDLRAVLTSDLQQFQKVPGLGKVRYLQLQAAKEICRRSDLIDLKKKTQITCSQQTLSYFKKRLRDYKNETFAALFLDNQHQVLTYEELFSGTINAATVYPRPLIERVLQLNAAAVILAHNHPSGTTRVSPQDLMLTKRIREALELVDTRLLDHLIIGDNEVYSILTQSAYPCQ